MITPRFLQSSRLTAAAAALFIGQASAIASSSGGHSSPTDGHASQRADVESVGGRYIQLRTLWTPLWSSPSTVRYQGLILRLYPAADNLYEACVKIPWAREALLIDFMDKPFTHNQYQDVERVKARIEGVLNTLDNRTLFERTEVFLAPVKMDEDSKALTLTCR